MSPGTWVVLADGRVRVVVAVEPRHVVVRRPSSLRPMRLHASAWARMVEGAEVLT